MKSRFALLAVVVGVTLVAAAVGADEGRFSVQFDDTPLSQVLAAFQRLDPSLQYALPGELGDLKVTASLVDMTVPAALQVVSAQCGLTAVQDGGVWQVRRQPQAAAPSPTGRSQRRPPPIFSAKPAETVAIGGSAAGLPPGGTAATTGAATTEKEEETPPLRLIMVKYADPSDLSWLFGGDVVEGGGLYGGGGGSGSSGSSGYGNSSSGSSRGSRGSGNYGGSSSSNRGSNSYSSSRRNSGSSSSY